MPSLFDDRENAEILRRIRSVRPDSGALWGRMQAGQMLAHCRQPLLVATGGLELKRGLIGILFGGMAKRKLLRPEPFGRGMPTAPEFRIRHAPDFAEEREKLVELARGFGRLGPAGMPKKPHPFFGELTPHEWDQLQWKHLDHHLRQFGC